MSIVKATQFLRNRATASSAPAKIPEAFPESPESRLLAALGQRGSIPLREVPNLSGLSVEGALNVVERLRAERKVIITERQDRQGKKYLTTF